MQHLFLGFNAPLCDFQGLCRHVKYNTIFFLFDYMHQHMLDEDLYGQFFTLMKVLDIIWDVFQWTIQRTFEVYKCVMISVIWLYAPCTMKKGVFCN